MFGIVRPCRHRLCGGLHQAWMAHLCGLCLTLRDEHGHLARLVTNYDGLLVSVLTEAQSPPSAPHRKALACALRGFKGAEVVSAQSEGARLAAAVSLVLAATKIRDHIDDGDFRSRLVAGVSGRIARSWAERGAHTAAGVRFDSAVLTDAVERQAVLEARPSTLLELTEPAETAVAAAFRHTAVLTAKPANELPLTEIGRCFGRVVHLLDAAEDLVEDRKRGAFNPLDATGTSLVRTRQLCEDAHHGITLAFADLDLVDGALARALLVDEVGRAIQRTFSAGISHRHKAGRRQRKGRCRDHCDCSCDCDCTACCRCGRGGGDGCSCDGCCCDC
ncbi:DUF5685 family protein [Nonomuraea sp. NPDC050663]|uniref:DUF5685 family protein n=1 Tax=Nonomuraea sp. NPDC050663 TaxID=3364370 RepID=UPI0037A1EF02